MAERRDDANNIGVFIWNRSLSKQAPEQLTNMMGPAMIERPAYEPHLSSFIAQVAPERVADDLVVADK